MRNMNTDKGDQCDEGFKTRRDGTNWERVQGSRSLQRPETVSLRKWWLHPLGVGLVGSQPLHIASE